MVSKAFVSNVAGKKGTCRARKLPNRTKTLMRLPLVAARSASTMSSTTLSSSFDTQSCRVTVSCWRKGLCFVRMGGSSSARDIASLALRPESMPLMAVFGAKLLEHETMVNFARLKFPERMRRDGCLQMYELGKMDIGYDKVLLRCSRVWLVDISTSTCKFPSPSLPDRRRWLVDLWLAYGVSDVNSDESVQ